MAKAKVFITTPTDASGESHRRMAALGIEVALGDPSWRNAFGATEADIMKGAEGAQVLVGASVRGVRITADMMRRMPGLRLVARYSIGVDDIDVEDAAAMGVLVTHAPVESNWGGVAEGTIAFMLGLLKRLRERDRHVKEGGWRTPTLDGTHLGARQDGYPGITVGIIGLGRIGSRVADLLAPWRVRLLACDPYVDESKFVHHAATPVDLPTLLRESDVVTVHCILTRETRHLISAPELALMKPTAILINTARGPLVDGDALFDALDRDRLGGAALDVFETEPVPPQTPLLGLGDKVLLGPHNVSQNRGTGLTLAVPWATECIIAALRGEVPRHVFDPSAIPLWRERFGGRSLI